MSRSLLFRSSLLLMLALTYSSFASPALAVEVFKVWASTSEGPPPVCEVDNAQHFGCSCNGQIDILKSACADRGILKTKSFVNGYCCGGFDHGAGSAWSQFYGDLVISGPPGPTSVPAILHMVLDGSISTSPPQNWSAQVDVSIDIPGVAVTGGMLVDLGGNWSSWGILSGQAGPGLVSLPIDVDLGMVPVNTPMTLHTYLGANVGYNPPPGGYLCRR